MISYWMMFAAGLGLAFTPCTLPMLPIVVSLVARNPGRSRLHALSLACCYVLGIVAVYAAMGAAAGAFGQQVNLPALFQKPIVLFLGGTLVLLLAANMAGLCEIQLPTNWQSALDNLGRKQQAGAFTGSFLMGLFSALVVSPCVSAPLAAALLHASAVANAAQGAWLLAAMAAGMGLPMLLLAVTEARILPKAGPWTIKVREAGAILLVLVAVGLYAKTAPAELEPALYVLWFALAGSWLWTITSGPIWIPARALSIAASGWALFLVAGNALPFACWTFEVCR